MSLLSKHTSGLTGKAAVRCAVRAYAKNNLRVRAVGPDIFASVISMGQRRIVFIGQRQRFRRKFNEKRRTQREQSARTESGAVS